MKKVVSILLAVIFVLPLGLCAADRDFDSMVPDPDHTMAKGLARGGINLGCFLIELPARTTYYSCLYSWNYIPYGLPMGIIDGCNFSVMRVVGGLYDVLLLGIPARNHTVYTLFEIPTMPWDSPWLPTKEEKEEIEW